MANEVEQEMEDITLNGKVIGQITADQLEKTKIPSLDIKPLDVESLVSKTKTDTAAITAEVLRRQQEQTKQVQETITKQTGITGTTPQEQLVKFEATRPELKEQEARESAEERFELTETERKYRDQAEIVTQARINLDTLEAERQAEIQNVNAQSTSVAFANSEKNRIQREYNTKIAKATAKLSSEAALASLYQGDLTRAETHINNAVNAYLHDYDAEIDRFDNLKSTYSDWIDDLDRDERDAFNLAYDELKTERAKTEEEKKTIGGLMLEYNQYGAGITLDDTMEEALRKSGIGTKEILRRKEAAEKAKGEAVGFTQAEQDSIIFGISSAIEKGEDPMDFINKLPTAQRLPALTLWTTQQLVQRQAKEIERSRVQDMLISEKITPETITRLEKEINPETGLPYTNDQLILMAPTEEKKEELYDAWAEKATMEREAALYGVGKGIGEAIEFVKGGEARKLPKKIVRGVIEKESEIIGGVVGPVFKGLKDILE